jgi:hypothetical protein
MDSFESERYSVIYTVNVIYLKNVVCPANISFEQCGMKVNQIMLITLVIDGELLYHHLRPSEDDRRALDRTDRYDSWYII